MQFRVEASKLWLLDTVIALCTTNLLHIKLRTLLKKSISIPLHPSGPKPKVPGAQRSHRLPTTFALH